MESLLAVKAGGHGRATRARASEEAIARARLVGNCLHVHPPPRLPFSHRLDIQMALSRWDAGRPLRPRSRTRELARPAIFAAEGRSD
jgi:hypothetical protein